jgi:hypothetical protein
LRALLPGSSQGQGASSSCGPEDGGLSRTEPGPVLKTVTAVLFFVPVATFALCLLTLLLFAVALVVGVFQG